MKKVLFCLALIILASSLAWSNPGKADTTGLAAYYPFSGSAADSSGKGNDGTVYGATLTADRVGNPNSAYSFDGTDDYILVPDAPALDFTTALTISAWVSPGICPQLEDGAPILCKGYGAGDEVYCLDISDYSFTALRFLCWVGGYHYQTIEYGWLTPEKVNRWYHIAAVYDGGAGTAKIYENGNLITSNSWLPSSLEANSHALSIGSREASVSSGYNTNFNGRLDDIRLYNRVLGQAEIDSLAGNTSLTSPLLIAPDSATVISAPYFPTFTWHRVDSAEYYEFQLSRYSTFDYMTENFTLTDTSYTPVVIPSGNGSYYWRVIAHQDIFYRISDAWDFQFGIPTLVSPAMDTAYAGSNTPVFIWNAVDSITYYQLLVSTVHDMSGSFVINHSLSETTYATLAPLPDGHYYWRVESFGNPIFEPFTSLTGHFSVNVYGGVGGQPEALPPFKLRINAPYPNPVRSSARIQWEIPDQSDVHLYVYNIAGQRLNTLLDERQAAGRHQLDWDLRDDTGNKVSSGVYLLRLSLGASTASTKITVIR